MRFEGILWLPPWLDEIKEIYTNSDEHIQTKRATYSTQEQGYIRARETSEEVWSEFTKANWENLLESLIFWLLVAFVKTP